LVAISDFEESLMTLITPPGQFRFLDLSIGKSSHYDEVLSKVKSGDKFLDIGCCFGQDVRRLVYDGAPISNVHGSDLEQPFLDLGYDLFLDEDKLPRSTFLAADIFAESSPLDKLKGDVDIIHAASFFHLFNLKDGTTIAHKLVGMLRKKSGNMILGRQMGNETAQEFTRKSGSGSMFRHNPESFKKWWEEIGEATGTKWSVDCERDPTRSWQSERGGEKEGAGAPMMEPGAMPLRYCVKMI
jgi:SAM-dependent methyltransferase